MLPLRRRAVAIEQRALRQCLQLVNVRFPEQKLCTQGAMLSARYM
jgi:hypothetical protein